MTLVYAIDEDGNEYLYGRLVSFVPDWAVHNFPMDQAPVWDEYVDEDDVGVRVTRGRDLMNDTTDPRTYKYMRLRHDQDIAWFGAYYRDSKRDHGFRKRGPLQSGSDWHGTRRERTHHQPGQWSFTCWKDNGRAYQEHGRV